MLDMTKLTGVMSYGRDQFVIAIQGSFHGPFTLDDGDWIIELLRDRKKRESILKGEG